MTHRYFKLDVQNESVSVEKFGLDGLTIYSWHCFYDGHWYADYITDETNDDLALDRIEKIMDETLRNVKKV